MYNDLFSIGPLTVHGYGLMIGLGIVAALSLSWRRAEARGIEQDAVTSLAIRVLLLGLLGAKLLFIFTNWQLLRTDPAQVLGSEGFVVYGGILLGLLGAVLYARRRGESFLAWADLLIPGVALAQGFGRIGCFLAGCCYGRATHSFLGVIFPAGSLAPAGVPLLPTQLFSSAGDFLIAAILLILDKRPHAEGKLLGWYLLLYSAGRFLVEFLRNDARGAVGALSTSQFISLFTFAAAIALLLRLKKGLDRD